MKQTQRNPENMPLSMLIHEVSKMFGDNLRRDDEKSGISDGYRMILFNLSNRDGISQLEIQKHSHFRAPSITSALQKMESEGLVERRSCSEDMRKTLVFITEKGRHAETLIRKITHETEKRMLDGVSEEEKKAIRDILIKMRANLSDNKEDKISG